MSNAYSHLVNLTLALFHLFVLCALYSILKVRRILKQRNRPLQNFDNMNNFLNLYNKRYTYTPTTEHRGMTAA